MKNNMIILLGLLLSIHVMGQDPGDLDTDYGSSGISIVSFMGLWTSCNTADHFQWKHEKSKHFGRGYVLWTPQSKWNT